MHTHAHARGNAFGGEWAFFIIAPNELSQAFFLNTLHA